MCSVMSNTEPLSFCNYHDHFPRKFISVVLHSGVAILLNVQEFREVKHNHKDSVFASAHIIEWNVFVFWCIVFSHMSFS